MRYAPWYVIAYRIILLPIYVTAMFAFMLSVGLVFGPEEAMDFFDQYKVR